jgi:hypothetical protein
LVLRLLKIVIIIIRTIIFVLFEALGLAFGACRSSLFLFVLGVVEIFGFGLKHERRRYLDGL